MLHPPRLPGISRPLPGAPPGWWEFGPPAGRETWRRGGLDARRHLPPGGLESMMLMMLVMTMRIMMRLRLLMMMIKMLLPMLVPH